MIATKQQQLTISISTINDTDYFGKGVSIYFFVIIFRFSATRRALKLVARALKASL
jgi:hypothetical protein